MTSDPLALISGGDSRLGAYVLRDRIPVRVPMQEWAMMASQDRCVSQTWIGDVCVSTFFLGLDHQFGEGPPLLFETMVFNSEIYCRRTSTWREAEAEHRLACKAIADSRGLLIQAVINGLAIAAVGVLLALWSVTQ